MPKNSTLNDSKALVLLRHLNKKELKDLGLWLNSPLHNTSQKVVKVYEYFKLKCRNTDHIVTEHQLLKVVGVTSSISKKYKISAKEKAMLQEVMYLLYVQIQDFLIWKRMREDEIRSKRCIMDIFLEKKLYSFIYLILNRAKTRLDSLPRRDTDYYEKNFQLIEMEFYLSILQSHRNTNMELHRVVEPLRQAFLSKSLKYYCSLINGEKIIKAKYEYNFLKYIKLYLEENDADREIPAIRVYYSLLKLIEHENPEDYFDLKKYLFENIDNFGTTDIRQFFNHMTNYCNWKIKYGEEKFVQERFEVYQKGIDLKCWSAGTFFSEHQFVHIVKTALALHKIDWVQDFFEEHKEMLNPKLQDVFVNYYQALLAFELKEYDKALHYLGQINTTEDFVYYVGFKILCIKIFYDNKTLNINNADTHTVNYEIESLRQYLLEGNNKNMAETTRLLYSNFANFFKRILNRKKKLIDIYEKSPTQANLQALQKDLTELKPLIERTWLEEKVTELMAALE